MVTDYVFDCKRRNVRHKVYNIKYERDQKFTCNNDVCRWIQWHEMSIVMETERKDGERKYYFVFIIKVIIKVVINQRSKYLPWKKNIHLG